MLLVHYGKMRGRVRALAWACGAVIALICTAVGMLLFNAGLDDADKWSSVIGMSVTTLIGVPATLYQVVLARRALKTSNSTPEVHVTASGKRSIAAQNIGSASTGDGSSSVSGTAPAVPRPPNDQSADRPDAALSDRPLQVRVEALGERSISAQNIGTASTGDTSSPSATG